MFERAKRKRRVEELVRENYWSGFDGRLAGSDQDTRSFEYGMAPQWWDDVADIAYAAGYRYGCEVVAAIVERETTDRTTWPFGRSIDRKIPARVYADAYAAARIACA